MIHEHTHVSHGPWCAEIDLGIAPLILALWRAGHGTIWSCEGRADEGGRAWIVFREPTGVDYLIGAIQAYWASLAGKGGEEMEAASAAADRIADRHRGRHWIFRVRGDSDPLSPLDDWPIGAVREVFFPAEDIALAARAVEHVISTGETPQALFRRHMAARLAALDAEAREDAA